MVQKQVSVMGCGWLGLPLAEQLVQRGYRVKGSSTTPAKLPVLQGIGISPVLLSFPENSRSSALRELLDAEVLVFNLPPSRAAAEANGFEQILQTVLDTRSTRLQHILFISSTSVYPDLNREVFELDATASPNSPSLLLRCEYLVQQIPEVSSTIVRLGGLMGGARHPGRFLAGKENVPSPQGPVNMIHLADCVGLLLEIIEQKKWGYTFNACAPQHPSRQDFYTQAAKRLGLVPPSFLPHGNASFKQVNSDLLLQELDYQFLYPDPLTCLNSPAF